MAKTLIPGTENLREIARQAGGNEFLIMFDPPTNELEMDDVTQAALDAAVTNYATLPPTSDYVDELTAQMNGHAQVILDRGFLDPGGSGKTLPLSPEDQLNYCQLYMVDDRTPDGRTVIFPLLYSTLDNLDSITLANAADAETIYSQTALILDDAMRDSAAAKQSIVAAATIAAAESASNTFLAT